jgi:hypothetical protein
MCRSSDYPLANMRAIVVSAAPTVTIAEGTCRYGPAQLPSLQTLLWVTWR